MQLFIDVDLNQLVLNPGNKNPVTSLSFKRGDTAQINVQFVQAGAVIELPPDAAGTMGIKKVGKYDDDFIVAALGWTKTGAGATATYTFSPSFNTVQLNALLDDDGDPLPSVQLMGEIEWTTGGKTESTNTFTATVANDVVKNNEAAPTDANAVGPNIVWAGPASGEADALPGFRALIDADLAATALRPPTIHSAAYAAVAGDRIETNTSAGGFAVTLPATPALGDQPIAIADATQSWAAHPLTIGRNGNPINGAASDFTCNVIGDRVTCTWIGGAWGWSVK